MSTTSPAVIRRPDKGLTISGTRVTLYALMDYLRVRWPADEIRESLNLTDAQLCAAMEYIEAHRDEVEAEYQQVLRDAQESRRYWEDRNREHYARMAATPPAPEKAALYAKLAEQRGQTIRELLAQNTGETIERRPDERPGTSQS